MYNGAVAPSTHGRTQYEAVIGLEVHAELSTRSKMFCACPVVDATQARPNSAVCPVCAGMPGALPVANRQAVEYGLRVALALGCEIAHTSLFARKNYFYPDLPKGYQISQYEYPLAQGGSLLISTGAEERSIRIRRVHLEEDTGKLTHITLEGQAASLVDLNRAGVPLLEIVSEPDMHNVEEVRAYAVELRDILRCLDVNSGDLEKGVMRFEANVSVRPSGSAELGTRTEIKNLNSFRAMEQAIACEIRRQARALGRGERVMQETLGWDEGEGTTYTQRSKEDAHDYRYFPEPDLPPLVVDTAWIERVRAGLPELPRARSVRYQDEFGLTAEKAYQLASDPAVSAYFEQCLQAAPPLNAQTVSNWICGEIFGWMNRSGEGIGRIRVPPGELAELLQLLKGRKVNQLTAKGVLAEMLQTGRRAQDIIAGSGLHQVSDVDKINLMVQGVISDNPKEVKDYLQGKETISNWLFGQVMRRAGGKADPQVVKDALYRQLKQLKE